MSIAFPHPLTTAKLSQEVRVVGRNYGSLLGPEFKVAVGDRYFWIGTLTLKLLKSGTPLEDLDLYEIDPDDEPEEY